MNNESRELKTNTLLNIRGFKIQNSKYLDKGNRTRNILLLNIQVRSNNDCCPVKEMCSEFMSVALVIQHAMQYYIVICSLS
jgi:hypothetical protein